MAKKIMMLAGEPSGDLQGAHLARSLRQTTTEVEISGMGGELMRSAGVNIYASVTDLAVIGFFEVLKNIKTFKEIFNLMVRKLDEEKPDAVVLIDYPGFNLRFAREVKKRGITLIYYISPQVWAWGKGRIRLIKELIDHMIVIFKFEEEFYQRHGVPVSFVGHPLLDIIKIKNPRDEILRHLNFDSSLPLISLLPGSRENEVKRHLPIMLEAAEKIKNQHAGAGTQFVILRSPNVKEEIFTRIKRADGQDIPILTQRHYDIIKSSDLALLSSGTATIEAAILRTPMIIIYQVSFLTWLMLRPLIHLSYLGMINIVAGKRVVPEYLQYRARADMISEEALLLLKNEEKKSEIKENLEEVGQRLGTPGASQRAAEIVLRLI